MPRSPIQPKLRASLLYLGSALFLTTGVVTVADQPIPLGGITPTNCGCVVRDGPGSWCTGWTCTYFDYCGEETCKETYVRSPYLQCNCPF